MIFINAPIRIPRREGENVLRVTKHIAGSSSKSFIPKSQKPQTGFGSDNASFQMVHRHTAPAQQLVTWDVQAPDTHIESAVLAGSSR